MKQIHYTFIAVLVVLLTAACGKDETEDFCNDEDNPECPNYNPCVQVFPASSDFKIVGSYTYGGDTIIDIEIDTGLSGPWVFFKVDNPIDSHRYEWKVGLDRRTFTGPEVNLNFTGFTGLVDVQLTTTTNNVGQCLRSDQLLDTQAKTVYLSGRTPNIPIYGVFRGKIGGNDQEFDVTIFRGNGNPATSNTVFGLPMPENCDFDTRGIPILSGYQNFVSRFVQRDVNRCRNLIVVGRINLEDRDEIRLDYVYDDDNGSRKEVVFTGRRQ